jgi:hypothetical protein
MSVYAVHKTGNGSVITWNGKPIEYRINWHHFEGWHRTIINEQMEDICARVQSGAKNPGQTSQKPDSGWDVWTNYKPTDIFVYALFDGGANQWLGKSNQHWVGDQYLGATVVLNAFYFDHPTWGTTNTFRSIVAHEIGHAVGLEHPTDESQLMGAHLDVRLPWKSGDLAGFQRLRDSTPN